MQLLLFTERERSSLDQDPEHEHVDDGSSCPVWFLHVFKPEWFENCLDSSAPQLKIKK